MTEKELENLRLIVRKATNDDTPKSGPLRQQKQKRKPTLVEKRAAMVIKGNMTKVLNDLWNEENVAHHSPEINDIIQILLKSEDARTKSDLQTL